MRNKPLKKWSNCILNDEETEKLLQLSKKFLKISQFGDISPGIVTGANSFFILNQEKIDKLKTPATHILPIIMKSSSIPPLLSFTSLDFENTISKNNRTHLLNLNGLAHESFSKELVAYIAKGEEEKINERYKCKNVGTPVTGEELSYLAGNTKEWARRVRELRTEDGWPIATKNTGRNDLPVGVYVLEEDRQAYEHDRIIPDPIRVAVLERDGFKCTCCGWSRDKLNRDDPRKMLELHHKQQHKDGGENTIENLITLCNVCHDDVHRQKK